MTSERLLLDTVFIQALLNRNDLYHDAAKAVLPRVRSAGRVWVTEAVLVEAANGLSSYNRSLDRARPSFPAPGVQHA